MPAKPRRTVTVGSINVPGYKANLDADKYAAARTALLKIMPKGLPGITQKEMFEAMRRELSRDQFPGTTHQWWAKSVQLDLERRGELRRDPKAKPLRWRRP